MRSKGALVSDGYKNFNVFDKDCPLIRDDTLAFLRLVKDGFLRNGILFLQLDDLEESDLVDFEIHFEIPKEASRSRVSKYLVRFESVFILPGSYKPSRLCEYKKIFSWNDSFVDKERFVKINVPNNIRLSTNRGWNGRTKLCCMIAGNKAVRQASPLELYSERVKTIRWFEQYAQQDFDLFGIGWDAPATRQGLVGTVVSRLQQKILARTGKVFFPSYKGRVNSKLQTLQNYRFSICYENVRDLPGYITEKIFDSFFAGCVPVYWGASNISTYVPGDCFIDRRQFDSYEKLHQFMVSMTEADYIAYQERIAAFLTSDQAKPFSAEAFAETLVNTIVSDLGITA